MRTIVQSHSKLRIQYPDGREEVLLNQPRYDFGWQREYHFDGQLKVPAGSRLIADYVYDNSEANAWNPDASQNRDLWRAELGRDDGDVHPVFLG